MINNTYSALGIKTRKCKLADFDFEKKLIKKTLFSYISKYISFDPKKFRQNFQNDYKNHIILMRGKRRIGFYYFDQNGDTLEINGIFLSPAYHSKGIGKSLMCYFESLGCRKIKLQVWDTNPAVEFYKKLGYKVVKNKNHKYFMEKSILK